MSGSYIHNKTLGLFVKTKGYLSRHLFAGKGFIICLHRVLPNAYRSSFWGSSGMSISPEYLGWLIGYIQKEGFELIGLDDVLPRLNSNKFSKPFAAITLDDGWRDNLTYGLPVFEKHKTPFGIYVTNCFPNNTAFAWAELLTRVVAEHSNVEVDFGSDPVQFSTVDRGEKVKAYNTIRNFILESDTLEKYNSRIAALVSAYDYPNETDALNWEEVKQLSNHELCTIGAHTMNHLPLAKLSEADALNEMVNSKIELELKLNRSVDHFAYPYGTANECSYREFDIAKKAGFVTAVTGRQANVFSGNANYSSAIPRYPIGESTGEERLRYIMNGVLHFSFNGFKQVVTN